jgi:hypothetical protein
VDFDIRLHLHLGPTYQMATCSDCGYSAGHDVECLNYKKDPPDPPTRQMPIPALVLVDWVDSAQPLPGWRHLDDPPALEVVNCRSVGWLIAEGDGVKMLAPNLGDVGSDNAQASGFIRIPIAAVTRQVTLREEG